MEKYNVKPAPRPVLRPKLVANLDNITDSAIRAVFTKDQTTQYALEAFVDTYSVRITTNTLAQGETIPNEFDSPSTRGGKEVYSPDKFWECKTLVDFVKGYKGLPGEQTSAYQKGCATRHKYR